MITDALFEQAELGKWLNYGDRKFSFPPVRGTHEECYRAIKSTPKISPAEELDLALLINAAHTQNIPRWENVRKNCLINSYIRIPAILTWMPHDSELAGIILEKNTQGEKLTSKFNLSKEISQWEENKDGLEEIFSWEENENRLFISPNKDVIWIPENRYSLGRINETDGLLIACLGREGAELFVKTARDSKKISANWGRNLKNIWQPEQRLAGLEEDSNNLVIYGYHSFGNDKGYAFGVSKINNHKK